MAKNVTVDGFLPRAEVDRHLAMTHCFLMLREQTEEGQAAFPTRLPEFLLAGKAVLASAVGDLELHLADRREIVYLRTTQPTELADAIEWLYRDRPTLEAVGQAGRLACLREFDYKRWGHVLYDFIQRHAVPT
jgi:hypothetical protein